MIWRTLTLNSKILKRVFIIGVCAQIMFIALFLLSENFRVTLSNLLESNIMIYTVFNLVLLVLWAIDTMLLMIAPFGYLLYLLSKNKKKTTTLIIDDVQKLCYDITIKTKEMIL